MAVNPNVEIGLTALSKHAMPGQTLTRGQIADVCGVSEQAIHYIERKAMGKLKKNPRAQQLFQELDA